MRRLMIIAALLGALGTTTAALAAGGAPITEKVLGAASISQHYNIDVRKPADVVVAKATVPPGASFGWHSHRAAVAVVVVLSRTGFHGDVVCRFPSFLFQRVI